MSSTGETTDFLYSNLSLPPNVLFAGSIAMHERHTAAIGADGVELTPVQPMVSRFMRRVLYRATMLEEIAADTAIYKGGQVPLIGREYQYEALGFDIRHDWSYEDGTISELVRAGHSSFRKEQGDNGLFAQTVPSWDTSLTWLARIQRITGRKLPTVLYPRFADGQIAYDDTNAPFAERTFQPGKDDWRAMGLREYSSIEEIRAAMNDRGLTGITFDVLHCRGFNDPLHMAQRLATAGLVTAIHLSVNRLDITGLHSALATETRQAKRSFASSAAAARKTPEGEMVGAIASEWRTNPAYTSVPKRVVLEDGPLGWPGKKRDHAAIIENVREIVLA